MRLLQSNLVYPRPIPSNLSLPFSSWLYSAVLLNPEPNRMIGTYLMARPFLESFQTYFLLHFRLPASVSEVGGELTQAIRESPTTPHLISPQVPPPILPLFPPAFRSVVQLFCALCSIIAVIPCTSYIQYWCLDVFYWTVHKGLSYGFISLASNSYHWLLTHIPKIHEGHQQLRSTWEICQRFLQSHFWGKTPPSKKNQLLPPPRNLSDFIYPKPSTPKAPPPGEILQETLQPTVLKF